MAKDVDVCTQCGGTQTCALKACALYWARRKAGWYDLPPPAVPAA